MTDFFIQGITQDSIVYLNGEFIPLSEAKISVLDRGFIFGDGIYEVVPGYNRKPFRLKEHVARLMRSLDKVSIQTGKDASFWEDLMRGMVEKSPWEDNYVYLQVTRGVAKRDHAFPNPPVAPTIFAMTSPFKRLTEQERTVGVKALSFPDERWLHCDIKSVSLLGNVLAKQYAVSHGVQDVVQFRDGLLTEGASANIWVVKNGVLLAPKRDNRILEGVRYPFLMELAAKVGVPFEERDITKAEVDNADELLLTAAMREVVAITTYDNKPVGEGVPGPVFWKLRKAYDEVLAAL
ncbi:aminotransferase class IV [Pelistega europaea]|uniref:D-amino acid aminotransferase n=1 Tax=Pelistega europaea TaxID=106147 RepID=A0A7Y4L869_9BURK|nr:aminotransferase class IV [Pelistega europaea]NOL48683.1 D-amino acid aminotransferase [Pelistega europaea]